MNRNRLLKKACSLLLSVLCLFSVIVISSPTAEAKDTFGTPVLYNGMVSGQFSVADFIVSQLRDYDSVDLDEFIQDIQDRFGIKIPERYEVTYAIKGTELYYDDIMDKVYLDKALYYADFDE